MASMVSRPVFSPALRGALHSPRSSIPTNVTSRILSRPFHLRSDIHPLYRRHALTPRSLRPLLLSSSLSASPPPPQKQQQSATRTLTTQIRTAIDTAVGSAPVVLFMKGTPETPQCGFSRTSIQILGLQGVDPSKFTAFNVLEDAELRSGIKEYSDWPTIPQLYVGGEFVGGCDILMGMHKDGSLATLLEDKGVLVKEEEGGEK